MEKVSLYPDLSPFESPRFHDGWSYSETGCLSADGFFTGLAAAHNRAHPPLHASFPGAVHPRSSSRSPSQPGPACLASGNAGEELVLDGRSPRCGVVSPTTPVLLTAPFARSAPVWLLGPYPRPHREQFGELMARVQYAPGAVGCGPRRPLLLAALGVSGPLPTSSARRSAAHYISGPLL